MHRVSPQTSTFAKGTAPMLARIPLPRRPNHGPSPHPGRPPARAGFTLIEILVVVIVISILLALLVPALTGVKAKANEAKVVVEIKQLESAISAFKVKYGVEPPSRFVIYLTAADWDADRPMMGLVRRMWPQFNFAMPGGAGVAYPASWTATRRMNSGEAMMFFLVGIIDTNGAPIGFSKNPATPFSPTGTNREGPFMEFDVARIKDSDGNTIPEYVDSLPNQQSPYLYFSSYEGKGYRPIELPNDGTNFTLLRDVYRVYTGTATPPPPPANVAAISSPSGTSLTLPPQKPQTYQIISPGIDGEYGLGGAFNASLPNAGLTDKRDYDNLTNFNGGRLSAN
jgi:prepilin-type N-terminal cleavage/methylation domain-containing protein